MVKNIIKDPNTSEPMTDNDLYRLHRQLGHCLPEPLIRIIQNAGKTWTGITVAVERVVSNCKVCSLHKRKPNRKHASLPRADDFNKVVSLDLVDMAKKGWILYAIDEFSRLTKGVVLKDKSAKSVVDGILQCWIFGGGMGPSPLSKYFFSDLQL